MQVGDADVVSVQAPAFRRTTMWQYRFEEAGRTLAAWGGLIIGMAIGVMIVLIILSLISLPGCQVTQFPPPEPEPVFRECVNQTLEDGWRLRCEIVADTQLCLCFLERIEDEE